MLIVRLRLLLTRRYYVCKLSMAAPGQDFQTIAHGVAQAHTVSGLLPHTQYSFRVAAESSAGLTDSDTTSVFMTLPLPPQPPHTLRCTVQLPQSGAQKRRGRGAPAPSLAVEWCSGAADGSTAQAASYDVEATAQPDSSEARTICTNSKATRAVLRGAEYNTTYAVRVRATGAAQIGESAWSAPVTVAVPPCAPKPPPVPTMSAPTLPASVPASNGITSPRGNLAARCDAPRRARATTAAAAALLVPTRRAGQR